MRRHSKNLTLGKDRELWEHNKNNKTRRKPGTTFILKQSAGSSGRALKRTNRGSGSNPLPSINKSLCSETGHIIKMEKYTIARWEGDEYIIEKEGKPIGETLTQRRAESILLWLKTSGELEFNEWKKGFIEEIFEEMEKHLIGNKIKYGDVVRIIKQKSGFEE